MKDFSDGEGDGSLTAFFGGGACSFNYFFRTEACFCLDGVYSFTILFSTCTCYSSSDGEFYSTALFHAAFSFAAFLSIASCYY